ncbi:MAG: proline--tRNA ligase [Crenarchaeota archaeon]|nr:proline--tRNA ligase [Thermoproteota archaeon]
MPEPPRSRWRGEFQRWFDWVLEVGGFYDYGRYPVKGVGVWLPYGFRLRRLVTSLIRDVLDSAGHEEVLLPIFIPETLLRKESEHIKGFESEVFWVTRAGVNELDVRLALRPTSETAISYMESFWIKSYKQLPKKYYQIVSMFRYETKATRPMIRLREVTTFKEAHTVHESFEDADATVAEAIELYKKIFDSLGIPYLVSRRPEWDKFAGAVYTVAFDTIMPDGRTLQIGTVHHLGQNFTIPFEVRIQRRDETIDYAWQTSYGISDRIIAATIALHGDDRGACLPPIVAPVQVVIVPIPSGGTIPDELKKTAEKLEEELKAAGLRVHTDWRLDVRPGRKYYEWEARGVPVRVELGAREAREGVLTVARRDKLEKLRIPLDTAVDEIKKLLDDIMNTLRQRAWSWLRSMTHRSTSVEEARSIVSKRMGVVEVPWCGREECGHRLEELLDAKILGTPLDEDASWVDGEKCMACGAKAVTVLRAAKTY